MQRRNMHHTTESTMMTKAGRVIGTESCETRVRVVTIFGWRKEKKIFFKSIHKMSGDWVREQLRSIDIDVDIINQFIELKINKRRFLRLNESRLEHYLPKLSIVVRRRRLSLSKHTHTHTQTLGSR